MNIAQFVKKLLKFFVIKPLPERINGWRYLIESLRIALISLALICLIFFLVFGYVNLYDSKFLTKNFLHGNEARYFDSTAIIIFFIITFVASFVVALNIIYIMSKRLHDFNASGWWVLLNFIPFINIILSLLLCFCPGSKKVNKYGDRPAKPTTSQKVVAVISFIFLYLPSFLFFFSSLF